MPSLTTVSVTASAWAAHRGPWRRHHPRSTAIAVTGSLESLRSPRSAVTRPGRHRHADRRQRRHPALPGPSRSPSRATGGRRPADRGAVALPGSPGNPAHPRRCNSRGVPVLSGVSAQLSRSSSSPRSRSKPFSVRIDSAWNWIPRKCGPATRWTSPVSGSASTATPAGVGRPRADERVVEADVLLAPVEVDR